MISGLRTSWRLLVMSLNFSWGVCSAMAKNICEPRGRLQRRGLLWSCPAEYGNSLFFFLFSSRHLCCLLFYDRCLVYVSQWVVVARTRAKASQPLLLAPTPSGAGSRSWRLQAGRRRIRIQPCLSLFDKARTTLLVFQKYARQRLPSTMACPFKSS